MVRRAFLFFAAAAVAATLSACAPPEPPTITVKEGKITSIDLQGMRVLVRVEATNKNKFDLTISSFEGKLKLDGKDMGNVSLVSPVKLATGDKTPLDVPLALTWNDVGGIAQLAAAGRDLPYDLDGTAAVGGEKLSVKVPFKVKGTVPKAELVKTVQRSIPGLPFMLPK